MRYELKSIGVWSVFKTSFFIFLVLGFLLGFFYALFFGFILSISDMAGLGQMDDFNPEAIGFGVLMIVLPIMFAFGSAVIYTIMNVVIVILYNLVTKLTGGLEFNFVALDQDSINKPVDNNLMVRPAQIPPTPPPPEKPTVNKSSEFTTPPPPTPTPPGAVISGDEPAIPLETDTPEKSKDSTDGTDNEKSS